MRERGVVAGRNAPYRKSLYERINWSSLAKDRSGRLHRLQQLPTGQPGDGGGAGSDVHSVVPLRNVELLMGPAFVIQDTIRNMHTGYHSQFEDV